MGSKPRLMPACRHASALWVVLTLGATLAGLLPPPRAFASEVYGSARTVGEGYMVMGPGTEPWFVNRRRLVQYVSLGVRDLLPPADPFALRRDPEDGQVELVSALRLRHDFGTYARWARDEAGSLVGSIDDRQIDLLYGHLRATRIWGLVDATLGRQFEFSGLDFYAFDGARVRVRSPAYVAFDVFGGFEVDGAAAFGYSRYELDGTALDASSRKRSPLFGAALRSDDLDWLDAEVAYRRTFSPASLVRGAESEATSDEPIDAIDLELVSARAALQLFDARISPYAAARYNLGTARVDNVDAGVSVRLTERHDMRVFYLRTIPAFDLDSIFNVFQMTPFEDIRAVLDVRWSRTWRAYVRGQGRISRVEPTDDRTRRIELGYGGAVGVAHTRRYVQARADGYALAGVGGLRTGGSLNGSWRRPAGRLRVDSGVYGVYFRDEATEDRHGYSVAGQLGVGLMFWNGMSLQVVGEEMFTSFLRPATRVLAVLDINWSLRVGQR